MAVGLEATPSDQALSLPYDGLRLRAPVPEPPTVRDFMTFERHLEGVMGLAGPNAVFPARWYEAPTFYFTNPYAVLGPQDDVPVPPGSALFDLELEVAAVIGTAGRDLHPNDAQACIAGYTILVDWSARDLQFAEMEVRLGPTKGKDTATTLGPILVTPDELEPWRTDTAFDLGMSVGINDRATCSARAPAAAAAWQNSGAGRASMCTRRCDLVTPSRSPSSNSAG